MKTMYYLSLLFFMFLFTLIIPPDAYPAGDNYPAGARQAGMSNASVMMSDLWTGCYHNQAGLAQISHISAGFHYENQFFIPENAFRAMAVAVPTKSGTLGLDFSSFGYSKYNENKVGLAFGRSFSKKFSTGIQLDYFYYHIAEDYGNVGVVTVEAGILSEPVKNLFWGLHIFNPVRAKIGKTGEEMPLVFRAGLGYNFSGKAFASIETEKDNRYKPVFKAGFEYCLVKNIYLRSGISSETSGYSFGLGCLMKKIKADIAFTHHQILGFTPHFTMSCEF
ncbi:MAG: hypothetical protein Q8907_10890 [Bacteroidota bacterium]|nr:hypothetical protein [Bacteroidota bacterium]MDP4274773.1 hypothetical protein [Bacteroidota bacterium]